jgi:hypothetical protein
MGLMSFLFKVFWVLFWGVFGIRKVVRVLYQEIEGECHSFKVG